MAPGHPCQLFPVTRATPTAPEPGNASALVRDVWPVSDSMGPEEAPPQMGTKGSAGLLQGEVVLEPSRVSTEKVEWRGWEKSMRGK